MTPKTDYIQLVSKAAGISYNEAKKRMNNARKNLEVTYREYYKKEFFTLSPTQQTITARILKLKRNRVNAAYEKVINATGLDKPAIRQQLKEFNEASGLKFNIELYAKFEVYNHADTALTEYAVQLQQRRELRNEIREDFKKVDNGELTYEQLQSKIDEFFNLTDTVSPASVMKLRAEQLKLSMPEIMTDSDLYKKAALDMESTIILLDFTASEYVSFHMYGKTFEEKRAFITDRERLSILKTINSPKGIDLLDNKYYTYEKLSSFFRRDMILVSSENDLDKFIDFCQNRETVVVKPPSGTLGKGVMPISTDKSTDFKQLLGDLLEDYDEFIIEELIKPHKKIRKLNPDSVNTVRFTTFLENGKATVHDTFMKVGQKGSFVDNGGAGGIFVHIDPMTGRFDTNGCAENGIIYSEHPHTGVKFMGYRLPKWKQARQLACDLAESMPEIVYGGWDLTFTQDRKWVIVEGNAKTQFFGQQCTINKGVREDFLNLIGHML